MHHREREQPFYNWLNGSCTKCSNTELNYVCGTCSVFISKLWLLPLDMLTLWLSAQIDDIQESIKTFKKPRPRNAFVPEIKTMHKKQILPSKFKWFLMNLKKNTTPSCFHFIKSFFVFRTMVKNRECQQFVFDCCPWYTQKLWCYLMYVLFSCACISFRMTHDGGPNHIDLQIYTRTAMPRCNLTKFSKQTLAVTFLF